MHFIVTTVAWYQKVTLHLNRDIDSSLIDWHTNLLLANGVSLHVKNHYHQSVPRQVSNLIIYLKTILKLLPSLNSSLMFACVPRSLPGD